MSETLPLTGERTVPGIWHENYWFARHEAAYRWLSGPSVRGRVLDAGCGEGYGAALLSAGGAERVVGLDYDAGSVRHVSSRYGGIACVRGNLVQTGFADESFDLVVSLQTVEHLWEQPRFVAECRRILRPGARLVISTPNRLTFPSGNWYHTHELTADELAGLVKAELDVLQVVGLRHGSRLAAWESVHGSCVDAQLARKPSSWPGALAELVRSVQYRDFEFSDAPAELEGSLDLLVVARKPPVGNTEHTGN